MVVRDLRRDVQDGTPEPPEESLIGRLPPLLLDGDDALRERCCGVGGGRRAPGLDVFVQKPEYVRPVPVFLDLLERDG